jgi:hypothetical protein
MVKTAAHIDLPPIGSTDTKFIDRPLINLGFTRGSGLDMQVHYQITIYQGNYYEHLPSWQPDQTGVVLPREDFEQMLTYAIMCGAAPVHYSVYYSFFWLDQQYMDNFKQQLAFLHHKYTGHAQ